MAAFIAKTVGGPYDGQEVEIGDLQAAMLDNPGATMFVIVDVGPAWGHKYETRDCGRTWHYAGRHPTPWADVEIFVEMFTDYQLAAGDIESNDPLDKLDLMFKPNRKGGSHV